MMWSHYHEQKSNGILLFSLTRLSGVFTVGLGTGIYLLMDYLMVNSCSNCTHY